ncbi:MAG TPA: GDP-mannose 4,6-dehydratase [Firmicutes bacterium]|nr:GDP-mannose 4,6-dehydratase [Bacillota bacterium]
MENKDFKFVKADITDRKVVSEIFGTESHMDRSIEKPSVFWLTNVIGTQAFLTAYRK